MAKKRQLKHTIFIACEGKNTERIYFEAIGEETSDHFAVTVYPEENTEDPTTHALGLIKEAQSRIYDFDEVWAVFDKNGYTRHPQTFALAATPINGKIVHIAFSSIAFEQWVLLHFTRSHTAYAKSAAIIQVLHNNHYFDGYAKTAYQETYITLRDSTIIALENAAWLRHHLHTSGALPGTPVYDVNPYTDVDVLVRRLLKIDETISWVSAGHSITVGHLTFTAEITNATSIGVTIANNGVEAIVYNDANSSHHFYLLNAAREVSTFALATTVTLLPGETKTFSLIAAASIAGKNFNFKFGHQRIMMEV